eukprot:3108460-Rhodomonas_salina.1
MSARSGHQRTAHYYHPLSRRHLAGRGGLWGTARARLRAPQALYWCRSCGPKVLGAVFANSLCATHTCRASVMAARMPCWMILSQ